MPETIAETRNSSGMSEEFHSALALPNDRMKPV